jgi:hypothetical protein
MAEPSGPDDAGARADAAAAASWPGMDRFAAVQEVLDRNAVLIRQIDANHRARTTEALQRNVVLVRELNANVGRIVELYGGLADTLLAAGAEGPEAGGAAGAAAGPGGGAAGAAAQPQQKQGHQQQGADGRGTRPAVPMGT